MDHQDYFIEKLMAGIKEASLLEEDELYNLANQIYVYYAGEDFLGLVTWSNRLRTSGANIRYNRSQQNAHIQLNRSYVEKFGKIELIEILKHELTHYYLYKRKKWKHGHGPEFVKTLKEIFKSNCVAAKYNEEIYRYHYYCQTCHGVYKSTKRIYRKIFCAKCVKNDQGKMKDQYQMKIRDSDTISRK